MAAKRGRPNLRQPQSDYIPCQLPALTTRLVSVIDDYLIRAVCYDRHDEILEVHLYAGGSYQEQGVGVGVDPCEIEDGRAVLSGED